MLHCQLCPGDLSRGALGDAGCGRGLGHGKLGKSTSIHRWWFNGLILGGSENDIQIYLLGPPLHKLDWGQGLEDN